MDGATAVTIPQTDIPIENLLLIHPHLRITTEPQSMKGTGMTDGIPTLVLDHLSAMHVATAHHLETTRSVAALLNAARTDVPLSALQVLDMYASIPLLISTRSTTSS